MALWQLWWVWVTAAVALATLEVFAPGYIFFGFAIGALAVGVALVAGITMNSLPVVMLAFAVFSLIAYVLMRRIFGVKNGSAKIWDRDINDN